VFFKSQILDERRRLAGASDKEVENACFMKVSEALAEGYFRRFMATANQESGPAQNDDEDEFWAGCNRVLESGKRWSQLVEECGGLGVLALLPNTGSLKINNFTMIGLSEDSFKNVLWTINRDHNMAWIKTSCALLDHYITDGMTGRLERDQLPLENQEDTVILALPAGSGELVKLLSFDHLKDMEG